MMCFMKERFLFSLPSPGAGKRRAWQAIDSSKGPPRGRLTGTDATGMNPGKSRKGPCSEVVSSQQHLGDPTAGLHHGEHILGGIGTEVHEHRAVLELACLAQGGLHVLGRSEEHTSELQSPCNLVCRLLLEKKKKLCTGVVHATRSS